MASSWLCLFRRCISSLIFVLFIIPATAQDNRGITVGAERSALVIGNSAYQSAPLLNPVNDAQDMSRVLSQLGFKVILKENADRRSMEDAIRSFGRQLRTGGVGLFYFAGHGMQVEGRNYLIPINAKIESEADVKYEAVDAGLVLGKMEDAKNQLNIVILDACRNNPFSRNFRSIDRGLARMDAPSGSLIVYSTAPGEVAADGSGRNGIFTQYLIKHMRTPNLPVEHVLKRVRVDVASETKQRQIPWESSSLMGDFYFKIEGGTDPLSSETPKSKTTELAAPSISTKKPDAEMIRDLLMFWENSYNAHNIEMILRCWDEQAVIATGANKNPLKKDSYAKILPNRLSILPRIEVLEIRDIKVKEDAAETKIMLRNFPTNEANYIGNRELHVTFVLKRGADNTWRFIKWDY